MEVQGKHHNSGTNWGLVGGATIGGAVGVKAGHSAANSMLAQLVGVGIGSRYQPERLPSTLSRGVAAEAGREFAHHVNLGIHPDYVAGGAAVIGGDALHNAPEIGAAVQKAAHQAGAAMPHGGQVVAGAGELAGAAIKASPQVVGAGLGVKFGRALPSLILIPLATVGLAAAGALLGSKLLHEIKEDRS